LTQNPFPNSKEKAGRFVGIAENIGEFLVMDQRHREINCKKCYKGSRRSKEGKLGRGHR